MFDDQAFLKTLPPDEVQALRDYKRAGAYRGAPDYARWLNGALLKQSLDEEAEMVVELIDRATHRFRLPEPAILFRATFDFVMARFPGRSFVYPAYMSVSRSDRNLARHFAPERPDCAGLLLRLHCPVGTPMALVEWTHPPDGANERECLLPRNMVFRVGERRSGSRDELIRYAGEDCARRLRGLEIWELEVGPEER